MKKKLPSGDRERERRHEGLRGELRWGPRPQEFAHQFQRGLLVSLGLDQHIEDPPLRIDGRQG